MWVSSPVINLPEMVDVGESYWLQIVGFVTRDRQMRELATSPYVSCIRLEAFPLEVVQANWSTIRLLYR